MFIQGLFLFFQTKLTMYRIFIAPHIRIRRLIMSYWEVMSDTFESIIHLNQSNRFVFFLNLNMKNYFLWVILKLVIQLQNLRRRVFLNNKFEICLGVKSDIRFLFNLFEQGLLILARFNVFSEIVLPESNQFLIPKLL